MRLITLRWAAECADCGALLAVGMQAGYERGCGTYCPQHVPTDPEIIRALRTDRNERKAERRDEWAAARQRKANALEARNALYVGDHAFNTQPGYIPERARANRRSERAWSEQKAANAHRGKAAALRAPVAVAGDAAMRRSAREEQAKQRLIAAGLVKGSCVIANPYQGVRRVLRLNPRSITVEGFPTSLGGPRQPLRVSYDCIELRSASDEAVAL